MTEEIENISFKDYYSALPDEDKSAFRVLFIDTYQMARSTFFKKLADNSWSVLEFEKLETLTGKKLKR